MTIILYLLLYKYIGDGMRRFKSKSKIRSNLVFKYLFILIFFYIIIKLCISMLFKLPINYIFDNYKIKKYKDYITDYTINKPKYMLSYYKDEVGNTLDAYYIYNTKPLVYIYNTHQTETYVGGKSVLDASLYLKNILSKYNITTIVEERNITEFMHNNSIPFDRSYYASELLIKDVIKKNNFSLIIDLHRDATSKEASTTTIKNKKYAKVLFVVGKNNKTYKYNLDLANKLNKLINNKYKTLSRGVLVKDGTGEKCRFNQHLSKDMILLEVGADKNTYEEVQNTLNILGPIIGEYLYG